MQRNLALYEINVVFTLLTNTEIFECLPSQVECLQDNNRLHMTVCFINLIRHSIVCGTAAGIDHVILMDITILQPMNILFVSLYITV